MNLVVFGLGYSASHFVRRHRAAFDAVAGTARTADKVADLSADLGPIGVDTHLFDGTRADPGLEAALARADAVLVSAQPRGGAGDAGRHADPVLARFGPAIDRAAGLRRIVYLSTIGVYGDHGGAWIDEGTPAEPDTERGRVRRVVEDAWLALGEDRERQGTPQVAVLRLAGIYGPGRNVLDDLREGTARRLDKPGQVFNRIHVEDIGAAVAAAFERPDAHGVWNVTDDEPAPAPDVVAYGARLLGLQPPPLVPFAGAELSPMARSFYGANRRVSNRKLKDGLAVVLRYPTYREGLEALARG